MLVAIFPHNIVLSVEEMQDEMILKGYVVNGRWVYKNNGHTEQACHISTGEIVNEWAVIPDSKVVYLPEILNRSGYNELLTWAKEQPATENLGSLFKAYEERVAAIIAAEDDNIPF